MGDQVLEEAKKELQENMSREALLTQAYCPSRKGEPYTTGFIVEDLDEEESLGFLSACRAHGVTPNSAFTVAVHGVTVDLLRAAGRLQEAYHLHEAHTTNLRRYMTPKSQRGTGTVQMKRLWRREAISVV